MASPAAAQVGPVFTTDSPWIRRAARPEARLRLICIPFAGGGASVYQSLPAILPPSIEVIALQLPGREDRTREDPPQDIAAVAAASAVALRPYLAKPFALYGHCAGALLAYEVAQQLGKRHGSWPTMLVAAAQPAPHLHRTASPLHELPDDRLIDEIRQRGGLPAAVQRRPDLIDVLLPLLRADFTLWEPYTPRTRDPLPCPVLTVRGRDDSLVQPDLTKPWSEYTTVGQTELLVDGGHYFITTLTPPDAGAIGRALLASL